MKRIAPTSTRSKRSPKHLFILRIVTISCLTIGITIIAFAFNFDIGTLCGYCPVGLSQIAAASRTVPPLLIYSLAAFVGIALLFGRFLCSWLCPTNLLPFKPKGSKAGVPRSHTANDPAGKADSKSLLAVSSPKRAAILVLGTIAASFVVGFPVFCLFCPIGLIFGFAYATVKSLTAYTPTWDLLVFPAILFAEFKLFRRWCSLVCPIGALASLIGRFSPIRFAPSKRASTCKSAQGCRACENTCPSGISALDTGLRNDEDCSLCLNCLGSCPHNAFRKPEPVSKREKDTRISRLGDR
ncbi:4Fe-4S binding protein [Berryella intestinalis]|uniref:4Fe-4S binding protein n=1 Tax=Berryella intestinalis TaxID=1531429 RepID=UPI0009E2C54B|nr:4Fe-4S binding protein [Berryella intestinalis]